MKTDKCNTAHKQNQGQKSHDCLNRNRKRLFQNSTTFHDKCSEETRNERNISQYIKAIENKPITNIILNREELKPTPLKLEMRQGCPLSTINQYNAGILRIIRQEKEIKGIKIGKK
jgi:hypothetical protein